jgi:hypothetical protein
MVLVCGDHARYNIKWVTCSPPAVQSLHKAITAPRRPIVPSPGQGLERLWRRAFLGCLPRQDLRGGVYSSELQVHLFRGCIINEEYDHQAAVLLADAFDPA